MQIVEPAFKPIFVGTVIDPSKVVDLKTIWHHGEDALKHIEQAGRTCYKSHDKITHNSAKKFAAMIRKHGHESVLEHVAVTALGIMDRGASHELVRHRVGITFSQESTRYCNYSKDKFGNEIHVIKPLNLEFPDVICEMYDNGQITHEESELQLSKYENWHQIMQKCELHYLRAIKQGQKPEHARSCLPIGLKTEIVITANLRQWRYIFKLRVQNRRAHPIIRFVFASGLRLFRKMFAPIFDDIYAPDFNIGTDDDIQRVKFETFSNNDLSDELMRRGVLLNELLK